MPIVDVSCITCINRPPICIIEVQFGFVYPNALTRQSNPVRVLHIACIRGGLYHGDDHPIIYLLYVDGSCVYLRLILWVCLNIGFDAFNDFFMIHVCLDFGVLFTCSFF